MCLNTVELSGEQANMRAKAAPMQSPPDRFLKPENSPHRKYEARRARFVDGLSVDEVTGRFGSAAGTLRNLRAAVLREPDEPCFRPDRRGRRKPRPGPDRDARIIGLRKERTLSAAESAAVRSLRALKLWGIGRPTQVMPGHGRDPRSGSGPLPRPQRHSQARPAHRVCGPGGPALRPRHDGALAARRPPNWSSTAA